MMPEAAAFATIHKPALLVAASDSPPEQRGMSEAMAGVLPNARSALVTGGHLIDPAAPEVLAFVAEVLEERVAPAPPSRDKEKRRLPGAHAFT